MTKKELVEALDGIIDDCEVLVCDDCGDLCYIIAVDTEAEIGKVYIDVEK